MAVADNVGEIIFRFLRRPTNKETIPQIIRNESVGQFLPNNHLFNQFLRSNRLY